jgi:TolB-like protein
MEELKQIALMSEAKHILYLIDACYGGIATVGSRGLDAIKTPNYIEKITKNKARQIITAGGRGEKVIEKAEWGHSAFTLNLNRGLKDGNADLNADNVITANELAVYLKEKVTIDSDNQQTPQYGRMTTQEGEFVFVYPIDLLSKFSLPSSSGKIKRHEIAILDFESIGIGLDEVKVLTKRLTSEIISLDIYKVLDLSLLNRRLRKQNYEYSVCSTSSCAMDIGKLIGVKYVVVGSISKIGETYSVDSRMIDVESEESFLTANYTTQESIDDIITRGAESISYQLCNMEVPKPKPPTIFERINIHKGKIFLTWLTLWLGWGLLPA